MAINTPLAFKSVFGFFASACVTVSHNGAGRPSFPGERGPNTQAQAKTILALRLDREVRFRSGDFTPDAALAESGEDVIRADRANAVISNGLKRIKFFLEA